MNKGIVDDIWSYDSRNCPERILSDYYKGFRLYLRPYKTGYKFYVAVRRHKQHGINDGLVGNTPVAYFKDCTLYQSKIKAIIHFNWMIS